MDLESSGLSLEEKLIYFIDRNDLNNVERLLKEGNFWEFLSINRAIKMMIFDNHLPVFQVYVLLIKFGNQPCRVWYIFPESAAWCIGCFNVHLRFLSQKYKIIKKYIF